MKPIEQIDAEVHAKVIEAVPDIVELKFGCRVDICKNSPHYVTVLRQFSSNTYFGEINAELREVVEVMDNFSVHRLPVSDIVQIIGRPISLPDILIAMDKLKKPEIVHILIESDGELMIECNGDDFPHYTGQWNLQKTYEDQEELVKRFIHDVICK
ncbi:MAG: hypothetical protein WC803_12845 [Sphingomonas sp.]|jgi:hypothetical protein